jgi:hypothetical protein
MRDAWHDRQQILANLQAALTLANELEMGTLGYLIERAIDEAQAAQFVRRSMMPLTGPHHPSRIHFSSDLGRRVPLN